MQLRSALATESTRHRDVERQFVVLALHLETTSRIFLVLQAVFCRRESRAPFLAKMRLVRAIFSACAIEVQLTRRTLDGGVRRRLLDRCDVDGGLWDNTRWVRRRSGLGNRGGLGNRSGLGNRG
jgi:hypothetical protein